MCLISLQPSTEAGIAQVLMRHLLLRTLEKACNSLMKKKTNGMLYNTEILAQNSSLKL